MNIVDMHCDTISVLYEKRADDAKEKLYLRENSGHVDLVKLQKSGYLLQNFALFVEKEACVDPWEQVQKLYALYQEELEKNRDIVAPVYQFADIEKNRAEGKISALLTVEEGAVCKGEIEKLCKLHEQGVRMMTLTWNYPNELGFPNLNGPRGQGMQQAAAKLSDVERDFMVKAYLNTPDVENGLTEKGREFVCKMQELGMIVDVSHLSDAGFYEVLECTTKPFVASHSNARAVCPCVRNMTDDMIRKLAERGGVMGLNFCADFLEQLPVGTPNPGTVAAIVEHARHITNVGGTEVLGLGSDFDGIATHQGLTDAGKMDLLFEGLKRGGFKSGQIDKMFSDNVLRVYKDILF
ncbi:MAG: dipeptidase [Lachnospiraceae bacterium]|nr:dipeptidase [Lachnospiraceae bacterium]